LPVAVVVGVVALADRAAAEALFEPLIQKQTLEILEQMV
jgi:hypothetical protein